MKSGRSITCISKVIAILAVTCSQVSCIWPPPYEINLEDSETFEISELWPSDDKLYEDEMEMIKSDDLKKLGVAVDEDDGKYGRIHQMAMRQNTKRGNEAELKKVRRPIRKIEERNFDLEDPIPWQAGFVNKHGDVIHPDNEKVYYLNEMAKGLIDEKIEQKREEQVVAAINLTEKEENYDYAHFKAEYNDEIKQAKNAKDTLNFTDVKEDESVKDAVETAIDFKKGPRNCTDEEMKGIGISAIKCIATDLSHSESKNQTLKLLGRIMRICFIWFCVYAIIAVPCWCTRGWCCCCCRCKCCKPRKLLDEAKAFYVNNPPGTYHNEEGEEIRYTPTEYENYAQKRLEKALFTL